MEYKKRYHIILFLLLVGTQLIAQKIQVVTEEMGPFSYTQNDNVVGFSTEIVEEMLKRAEIEYEITSHPWSETFQIAQNEPNVIIYSIARNVERESGFKWIGVIAELDVYFFHLKNRVDIKIRNLDDAAKYRIGVVEDDFRHSFLLQGSYTNTLIPVASDDINIKNIFDHKIDIFPADEQVAYHICHRAGFAFNDLKKSLYLKDLSVDLYIAASITTSDEVVTKCRMALNELIDDGTYDKIKSKYDIFYLPKFDYIK